MSATLEHELTRHPSAGSVPANSAMNAAVDIAHLTYVPPFAAGSFNRTTRALMHRLPEFGQRIVSHWNGPAPDDRPEMDNVVLVGRRDLSRLQSGLLRLPTRVRSMLCGGIGGRGSLSYLWGVTKQLRQMKPKVVVCYDYPWLGPPLRRAIDWPCRLILSQRGLSYYQDPAAAQKIYSLASFDVVWTMSLASYRADRCRMSAYEPLVKVLPNSVDTERFSPVTDAEKRHCRARWNLPTNRPVALLLSVMRPKKGAHLILHSWPQVLRQVPDALLWIVGGEDRTYGSGYLDYLKEIVGRLGIADSVRFEGPVPATETASCYQATDVYVFPTLAAEGWGLSISEALACGVASVVSDYDVGREAFTDKEVIFVHDPNVEDAFVEPIARLLTDASLRREMGAAARTLVESRYSYDAVTPQFREFFTRQIELAGADSRNVVR